ncbi:hypothetical protein Ssed_4239 [Shewanella sediminis HAW-EB3]|uniref:Histidine kinase/HSP90-like ATPase domain-containing protein n=1 Tax=Shewanella sediminis (strain HAW-EB3) TaxID=425104 RepID=A8G170_SHESH|nr:hypothetical protein [Shewanella sediminis]ABV38843.1 hypothetical protein Ssed_4239 [Shewanella sediminis HAW-EB3]
MKNLSTDSLLWQKRTSHNLRRKGKKYNPNKVPFNRVLNQMMLEAPDSLDLYDPEKNQEILDFIENIEKIALTHKVVLDFSITRFISAAALLLIYAKLDAMKSSALHNLVRIKADSLKGQVKSAITKSGLKELTLNRRLEINPHSRTIPIIKGSARGEEFEQVIDHIQLNILKDLTPEQERVLGSAVSETIGNVKLHAYPDDSTDQKPWWIICSIIDDSLYLAIFDLGVGIPATILSKSWVQRQISSAPNLLKLAVSKSDADLIELSMRVGKTQTKEEKHGLGSASIKALVHETPNGSLWIFSNKGMYHKHREGFETSNFKSSIEGTLVQWNIQIR